MASRIQRELAFLLTGRDVSASKAMKGVSRNITALERHSGKAFRAMSRNVEHGLVIGAGAAAGAIAYAVKLAGDFQAGMQTINTVALKSPAALAKAGEGIRAIFRDTGQPMADLQAAEYDLVSAGIKLENANDGLRQSVELGRGAYGSTAEAVDVLTTAVNSYNLKAKDGSVATATWRRVSDELAQAVADGKVKLSEIAATYAQVAPLAAQAGIGTDEVAAALGFLTAKGNSAGETLTQMSRAIIELQKPNAKLASLQKKLGKNYADIARNKGLHVALQQLRDDADKQGVSFISLFGRIEGYKYALQTTGPNARGFADELDRIHHSAGMTQRQFDERNQGLNYQLGVLRANVEDAGITIGTALLPQITELAKEGTDWLQGHQPEIKQFAQDLADGLRDAVKWAKSLDWDRITAALQAGGSAAQAIITAFTSAPAWLQEFLAAGFVANKFTGGALGDIGTDILGGLAKGLILKSLGIQAAVVNVSGGVVNGPGGGLPGGGIGTGEAVAEGAAGGGLLAGVSVLGGALAVMIVGSKVSGLDNPDRLHDPVTGNVIRQSQTDPTGAEGLLHSIQSLQVAIDTGQRTDPFAKQQLADMKAQLAKLNGTAHDMDKNLEQFAPGGRDTDKNLKRPKGVFAELKADGIDLAAIARNRTASLQGATGGATPRDMDKNLVSPITKAQDEARLAFVSSSRAIATSVDGVNTTARGGLEVAASAVHTGTSGTTAAVFSASAAITGAIRSIPAPIVNVNVSPTTITNKTVIQNRAGTVSGSRGATNDHGKG